ncbi:MAG: hypothetical protein ACRDUV_15065 [Pseudonocardiaceae bacterium]
MSEFSSVLFLAPLYGGGAVVVREVTRRSGRGWPTMRTGSRWPVAPS